MIVDDGSHRVNHIFASLSALWPVLKPGGVYIMEDLDEHWFVPETWAMYETGPPATLPIPLFQRLIHSINCLTKDTFAYSKDYKAWCRKEQANSIFKCVGLGAVRQQRSGGGWWHAGAAFGRPPTTLPAPSPPSLTPSAAYLLIFAEM